MLANLAILGPPARCPSPRFFFGEGSPTEIDYRKKVPYSNLSTGGSRVYEPNHCFHGGLNPRVGNDDPLVNANQERLPMASKWCLIGFRNHPQLAHPGLHKR